MRKHLSSLMSVAMLLLALCLWACTTNPATGKTQLNYISTSQEVSLGEQSEPEFLAQYGGEINSPAIRSYVSNLGMRLAAQSERPTLPWNYHVVDSSVINAFALPGGKVFITRGLLANLENEAQLAGVLGHETGHVTAQHISQQMTQALGVQLLGAGLGAAAEYSNKDYLRVLGVGAQAGGSLYLLKFGRDQETQADELGMRYMSRLSYDPQAQVQVMEVLKKVAGGGAGQPEFLSTHPLPQTRITHLTGVLNQQYPDYKDTNKYRYAADEFKAKVLLPLSKLPPPKHNPAAQ